VVETAHVQLRHKRAVVTGGAMGIGEAIARRLSAEDCRVLIADLDDEAGAATVSELQCAFVAADVSTEPGIRAVMGAARSTSWMVSTCW
jgi:NAD(P)-dependent dehydrogenase (short-subunit alcohol dehydrogenase family)